MTVHILIERLDPDMPLPIYEHPGDAGLDLHSRVSIALAPGARALVLTGIAIALPTGFMALVHPRSGLALKHGVTLLNSPGTIDAGYRGEIGVILINHDPVANAVIERGDRIAQLVIQEVARASWVEVAMLPGSHRGAGGFGSTGGLTGTLHDKEEQ
jgi:dUTP pyrophosphatase